MQHQAIKPQLAIVGDSECELSDVWMEATDPENERGEECIGIFSHNTDLDGDLQSVTLEGLRITGGGFGAPFVTEYRTREEAISALGIEHVWLLEDLHAAEIVEEV